MRKLLTGLTVLAALGFAGTSQAANGTIDVSWNQCTPTVTDITTTTPGAYGLFLSVLGMDVPHTAYEVNVIYGNASQVVPDAWRFDAAGCQGAAYISLDHLPPSSVSKTCPALQGNASSLQIKDVSFAPANLGYATTLLRITLANSYPAGQTPVITQRYFLARFNFDHSFSVAGPGTPGSNCGDWDQPVCFKLSRANYVDLPGAEHPFGRPAVVQVSFQGPSACAFVPVHAKTWGQIKNQYRN